MQSKTDGLIAGVADVIICFSSTLHKLLESLMTGAAVPIVHIADPTGATMKEVALKKVALFGTLPIMQMSYLKDRFRDHFGVEAIAPTEAEQRDIDRIVFDKLVKGKLTEASRARYLEIADRMRCKNDLDCLILRSTDIFFLIDQEDRPDFPMFNTVQLNCKAAVDFALSLTVPQAAVRAAESFYRSLDFAECIRQRPICYPAKYCAGPPAHCAKAGVYPCIE